MNDLTPNPPMPGAPLDDIYRALHLHPELSFQEHATAALAAAELRALGFEVLTGVGGTGVVGVLRNGDGPTVLLRADMDALPVEEQTGLPYASTVRGPDPDGHDVPVMHACGHDVHTTCLIGAARRLSAERGSWSGILEVLFQPAEELGVGAKAMADEKLFDRIPRPQIVLGQHVAPLPAGIVALQPGLAFAAADGIRVTFYGRGGHGSRPETTVDPIVMAAAAVLRLQTIVSRETAATDSLVLTIGAVRAGTKNNVIPETAELLLSMRTFDPSVRATALAAIERIARGESISAGAPREATVEVYESFASVVNDEVAAAQTRDALAAQFGDERVIVPGSVTGSEDVGVLARLRPVRRAASGCSAEPTRCCSPRPVRLSRSRASWPTSRRTTPRPSRPSSSPRSPSAWPRWSPPLAPGWPRGLSVLKVRPRRKLLR